ncbi:MAG: solute:sodium symporter family transporter, partial [Pseudomonadota bacterium]
AFHLYGPGLGSIDEAYPRLIRDVLPVWMSGFFLAVLLGAVFSSFNSLLNSAATLFALDVYAPALKRAASDAELVRVAKIASLVIAIGSFIIAPMLTFASEGLFQVIRKFTGFYNIPTIAIVMVGLFTRRVPALGAKLVIVFHVIAYGLLRFALEDVVTLHFIHQYAVLFVIEVGIMLACGALRPRETAWQFTRDERVDMKEWPLAKPLAGTLLSCVVAAYLLFSPLGLAGGEGITLVFAALTSALVIANLVFWALALRGALPVR